MMMVAEEILARTMSIGLGGRFARLTLDKYTMIAMMMMTKHHKRHPMEKVLFNFCCTFIFLSAPRFLSTIYLMG
jgi:hypothetical protein